MRIDVIDQRERGVDSIAERFGGIFEGQGRRGDKPVEGLVIGRFEIVGLLERTTICRHFRQPRFDDVLHFVDRVLGGRKVRRRRGHLFDRARARIRSKAELDRLRNKIVHRRFHVFVEIENDRVMLQIGSERFFVSRCRDEKMNARPGVDVWQKGDKGLALIGFAVAPGKARQRRSKQNAHGAACSAIER
jgi:hypothetical protein